MNQKPRAVFGGYGGNGKTVEFRLLQVSKHLGLIKTSQPKSPKPHSMPNHKALTRDENPWGWREGCDECDKHPDLLQK